MNSKDYCGYTVWDDGTVIGKFGKPLKPKINKHTGYSFLSLCINRTTYEVTVHSLIAKLFLPNFYGKPSIDHKNNKDKTNNSLYNLRWATYEEQRRNTGMYSNNKSGFKGVMFESQFDTWRARLIVNGRTYQKRFKTKEEAIAQRLEWEKIYYQ